VRIKSSCCSQL